MINSGKVIEAMIDYYGTDLRRINHFLKVFSFAKTIGEAENLDEKDLNMLEITAVVHDIGIKISEKRHNSSSGYYQQLEGPNEARTLLERLGIEDTIIDRVCWLIAHHHTYQNIDKPDYQILVEADFLVNVYEDNMDKNAIERIKTKVFRTESGRRLLDMMY